MSAINSSPICPPTLLMRSSPRASCTSSTAANTACSILLRACSH
ncbi:Uncharacterised protein [Vibrio cholerae]|nr:Uncharacterised protein [Vibrio cholerae]